MTKKLSTRIRPDCEAAPWVIEEIKKLECELESTQANPLEYVARLERDRAELIEALKMAHGAIMETNSAKFTKTYDLVGALLSRLGAE